VKPNETVNETANHLGCTSGIRNIKIPSDTSIQDPPIFVPINYDMKTKLEWFSGFVEPFTFEYNTNSEDQHIYIPSKSLVFLQDVKYMLQTCGTNTVIRTIHHASNNSNIYELILHVCQIKQLMLFGMTFATPNHDIQDNMCLTAEEFAYQPPIHILSTEPVLGRVDDTYCFTEPMNHAGIFNGIRTGQCTEIIEYSDENETAVCNLASIALPSFLRKPSDTNPVEIESAKSTNGLIFDYSLLHEVTKVVTGNLNRIIDVNYYPTTKTRTSNMRHRPIGIGIQGLADVFLQLGWAFTSPEAKQLNKSAFETIYHASLERSCELAVQDGPYETFHGSPASEGILQFDMWETTPDSNMYDWNHMRETIRTNGLRNSLLLAPMPTASTSQILGYNECMEPITSNIYSRRTLAGEFILVNKYLMNELLSLNLWNETLKNHMVANNGSIQDIEYIPQDIRDKYKTVWEIPMRDLIDMSADRGAFICQSQSLNLWLEEPDYKTMTSMHFYSWSKGLKTGIYYLRRRPRHQPQQFTIEPGKTPSSTIQPQEEICEMCSA
jgi:ribonucleotide reductase alpha subunit